MNTKKGCVVCFNALGVPSRMKIYNYLKKNGKQTVSSVVAHVGLTQPTISYHLKEMRLAGILDSTKKGKEVYYTVEHHCGKYDKDCVLSSVDFAED